MEAPVVVEPIVQPVVEPIKLPEPTSTFYQYVPTEPVVFAPHVEYVDPKHIAGQALGKEVDELKRIVSDQHKMLEFLLAKLK